MVLWLFWGGRGGMVVPPLGEAHYESWIQFEPSRDQVSSLSEPATPVLLCQHQSTTRFGGEGA